MININFEPLKVFLENNKHSDYYNVLVLKRSLNILSFKEIINESEPNEVVSQKVNEYPNQLELFEFVKISMDSNVSFKDMILPKLAEPFIVFN